MARPRRVGTIVAVVAMSSVAALAIPQPLTGQGPGTGRAGRG
jgi:hypothetical protein